MTVAIGLVLALSPSIRPSAAAEPFAPAVDGKGGVVEPAPKRARIASKVPFVWTDERAAALGIAIATRGVDALFGTQDERTAAAIVGTAPSIPTDDPAALTRSVAAAAERDRSERVARFRPDLPPTLTGVPQVIASAPIVAPVETAALPPLPRPVRIVTSRVPIVDPPPTARDDPVGVVEIPFDPVDPPAAVSSPVEPPPAFVGPDTVREGVAVASLPPPTERTASSPPDPSPPVEQGSAEPVDDPATMLRGVGPEAPARIDVLLERGREAFRQVDLDSARSWFSRAADLGSAEGAEWMARTYDPVDLAGVRILGGARPDPDLAREWRDRAESLRTDAGG